MKAIIIGGVGHRTVVDALVPVQRSSASNRIVSGVVTRMDNFSHD